MIILYVGFEESYFHVLTVSDEEQILGNFRLSKDVIANEKEDIKSLVLS